MNRSRQHGAALIVGLILLMVLTLLAASTMRTASLELLMAGNMQFRENAFQLAQAGIDTTLRAPPAAAAPDCDIAPWDPDVAIPALGGRYTTRICERGITQPLNSTIDVLNFEVTSDGSTDQRGARARLVQGYSRRLASGN